MKDPLNILTIGAGAIGTYIGGSLALFGHQVVFLEHPKNVDQIRNHGLTIIIHDQTHHIPKAEIVSSLGYALKRGPFDFAIFALKSFDTDSFIETILPFCEELPPFLCFSNGVENETKLAEVLGWHRVIPGTVTSAVSRQQAGMITLERLRGIGIAAGHPLARRITLSMKQAGLNARLLRNAANMKWSKLLTNLISNASSAILNLPPQEIYSHTGLYWIEHLQLLETLTVMRAEGIKAINLPGTPVRLLAFTIRTLPKKVSQLLLQRAVIGGRGKKMPSLYLDLHSYRGKSEVDYLNGAVVRAGQKTNIPTPVNQYLTQILKGLISGEIDIEIFQGQPEKLVAHISDWIPAQGT